MTQEVRLTTRPGQRVKFPNECAACGRPATGRLEIARRSGQTTRAVDVPVCAECARLAGSRSAEEERRLRLGQLAAGLAAFAAAALGAALPDNWALRLALGFTLALGAGALVWRAAKRWAARAMLPEKTAVLSSARLVDFTWRGMTLAFARDDFAARVRELNDDPAAVEVAPPAPVQAEAEAEG